MSYCGHHQANIMVPVMKKSENVRICVDLKKLNEEVKRETFVLPTTDDVTSKLADATVFTSIDAVIGFYQILLYKDSQEFTTFITSFGRYCLRHSVSRQHLNSSCGRCQLFEGVEGVFSYMDDPGLWQRP